MKVHPLADRPTLSVWTGCHHRESRVWLVLLLVAALSVAAVDSVRAQDAPPLGIRVSFVADRSELTVGDVVTLSLVIAHPADLVVVVPRLEREWGPFEVRDQTSVQTISVDGGIRTIAKQFRVTLFEPGDFETPVLPITVRGPDGSVQQIEPAPVQLAVNSVLSGSGDELKDLRPQADFTTAFWDRPIVLIIGALIILVILGATGYFLYRRSGRTETSAAIEVDTRSPSEVAIQELDRIARLDLPANGDLKEHYTLVSGALRTCLGSAFLRGEDQANVADMSTEEIGTAVRQSSLDSGNAREIIELLQEADLVKFANYVPPASRAYQAAGQARALVEAMPPSVQQRTAVAASAGGAATA